MKNGQTEKLASWNETQTEVAEIRRTRFLELGRKHPEWSADRVNKAVRREFGKGVTSPARLMAEARGVEPGTRARRMYWSVAQRELMERARAAARLAGGSETAPVPRAVGLLPRAVGLPEEQLALMTELLERLRAADIRPEVQAAPASPNDQLASIQLLLEQVPGLTYLEVDSSGAIRYQIKVQP